MSDEKAVYITTTLPYVNAAPHVGFAMEIIRADSLARYYRSLGKQVFLNTGTDEHGAKIHEAAMAEGVSPQEYTDKLAVRFKDLAPALNLQIDNFIRTTDVHHVAAAQEFWKICEKKGDIYKKQYSVKYCVGCELEKTDSELVDGRCAIHPNREIELRDEENYFFKFSNYEKPLLAFYEAHPDFVIPDFRFNEMRAFVSGGLQDFSISRLATKMPWGVPVPGDEEHVMYVWFDALVNYVSAIGWPTDMKKFESLWPVIQYCGKDNNRQQSAMWQAMLMSAGLPNSKHIIINGFIVSGGQKMSKSLGNVISPFDVIEHFKPLTPFPEDVLRFVLLHDIPSFEDGDMTMESIAISYASNLQNGIGNLTNRIMKMATTYGVAATFEELDGANTTQGLSLFMEGFDLQKGIGSIVERMRELDRTIQSTEPFKKIKVDPEAAKRDVHAMLIELYAIGRDLAIFLPRTGAAVMNFVKENKMPETPLFNRAS